MKVSDALASHISRNARTRGADYFASGAVRSLHAENGVVEASVRGGETYSVWLSSEGARLIGSCTCAYFDDHFTMCKHIWAVVLAAEAQSLPLVPAGVNPADVVFEPDEPPYLDEWLPVDPDEQKGKRADVMPPAIPFFSRGGRTGWAIVSPSPRQDPKPTHRPGRP